MEYNCAQDLIDERDRLRAQVAALRAALEDIRKHAYDHSCRYCGYGEERAREALAATEGKEKS